MKHLLIFTVIITVTSFTYIFTNKLKYNGQVIEARNLLIKIQLKNSTYDDTQQSRLDRLNNFCQTKFNKYKKSYCHWFKNSKNKGIPEGEKVNHNKHFYRVVDCSDYNDDDQVLKSQNLPNAFPPAAGFPTYNWMDLPDQNITVCETFKAASTTNDRMILAILTGQYDFYLNETIPYGPEWDPLIYDKLPGYFKKSKNDRQKSILQQFRPESKDQTNQFKLITTRHPFARLYSGWKDKFRITNERPSEFKRFNARFGKAIQKYENPKKDPIPKDSSCSFKAFLKYVADANFFRDASGLKDQSLYIREFIHQSLYKDLDNRGMDIHFQPTINSCFPCEASFNFIAKAETMSDDLVEFYSTALENTNNPQNLELSNLLKTKKDQLLVTKPYSNTAGAAKLKNIFLELNETEPVLIMKLYRKYQFDFEAFGYEIFEF